MPIWNVQLAPESPLRKSLEMQHDESSYDSFHNYETGERNCCDTLSTPSLLTHIAVENSRTEKCINSKQKRFPLREILFRHAKASAIKVSESGRSLLFYFFLIMLIKTAVR